VTRPTFAGFRRVPSDICASALRRFKVLSLKFKAGKSELRRLAGSAVATLWRDEPLAPPAPGSVGFRRISGEGAQIGGALPRRRYVRATDRRQRNVGASSQRVLRVVTGSYAWLRIKKIIFFIRYMKCETEDRSARSQTGTPESGVLPTRDGKSRGLGSRTRTSTIRGAKISPNSSCKWHCISYPVLCLNAACADVHIYRLRKES
jgi:hypothetical protein